jgi:hypothetical protein
LAALHWRPSVVRHLATWTAILVVLGLGAGVGLLRGTIAESLPGRIADVFLGLFFLPILGAGVIAYFKSTTFLRNICFPKADRVNL